LKVVVTGGAGFIGANLCRELTSRAGVERVVAFDDLSTGSPANLLGVEVELVRASILDRAALHDVVAGADAVVHLAARPSVPRSVSDPVASHDANATGTLYVLEACRASGARLVAASSSSVYGDVAALPKHEELATRPRSPYAASKLAGEAYVLAYGATYQVPTLALRFFNVYGPLQSAGHAYAAVIPAFIDAALHGQPLPVHGDGRQTRDFTFVGSVVSVLADAILRGVRSSGPVNLAFGTRISILELVAKLGDLFQRPVEVAWQPARPADVRDSQAADGRLRELFPDVAAVPLLDGLARTVAWFESLPQYADRQFAATKAGPSA
jgi:UDP-glucose 4-epimerase